MGKKISFENRQKKQYVYLLKPKGAINDLDKYYIGITYNPGYRMACHEGKIPRRKGKNPFINKAAKSGLEMVVIYSHPSRNAVAAIEKALRPRKNMGWNLAIGGEKPSNKLTDADKSWNKKVRRDPDKPIRIAREIREAFHKAVPVKKPKSKALAVVALVTTIALIVRSIL